MSAPFTMTLLLQGAIAAYALTFCLALFGARLARASLALGVAVHLGWMIWRGVAIGYFPLTSKAESFSAAALAFSGVALAAWRPERGFSLTQMTFTLAAAVAAARFPQELSYPVPLLRTVWYPLHVPLSFLAMGAWVAAAGAGLTWAVNRERAWIVMVDRLALQGFGLWSAAMIFGGIWGVVAWGAYFMWDPKVIGSVILWFHYASFVHLRLAPSLVSRPWIRPALAFAGVFWIAMAYVGTSFFFGKSSHAF